MPQTIVPTDISGDAKSESIMQLGTMIKLQKNK